MLTNGLIPAKPSSFVLVLTLFGFHTGNWVTSFGLRVTPHCNDTSCSTKPTISGAAGTRRPSYVSELVRPAAAARQLVDLRAANPKMSLITSQRSLNAPKMIPAALLNRQRDTVANYVCTGQTMWS